MKFTDFMMDRFSRGITKSVFFVGEGGSGKTNSLYKLYTEIHRVGGMISYDYGISKKIIPLYIPLYEANGKINSSYITEYIWRKFAKQNIDSHTVGNVITLFNKENSKYHFMLMLDGLNEATSGYKLGSEIKDLSKYKNVTICLTAREMVFDYFFVKSMDVIELSKLVHPVVQDKIKKYGIILTEEEIDILCRPFYLTKWIEMAEDKKGYKGFNKGSLIQQYINWLTARARNNHSARTEIINGEEKDYYKVLGEVIEHLAMISSHIFKKNQMEFSIEQIKKDGVGVYKSLNINSDIVDIFLLPLGIVRKTKEGYYRFDHQIYRDYFTALDLVNICNDEHREASILFNCSKEVLDIICNVLFEKNTFMDDEHRFSISAKEYLRRIHLEFNNPTNFIRKNLTVHCYLMFNVIEQVYNGDIEKAIFCKSLSDLTEVSADYIIAHKETVFSDLENELLRIHVEVLRRCGDRENQAIKYSEQEKELCVRHGMDICKAENGWAKIALYKAFTHAAERNGEYDNNIASEYRLSIDSLKQIKDLYTPTANLYSMLLAFPDTVSAKYLEKIWMGQDIIERRIEAARLCWNTIRQNIARGNNSSHIKNYTIVQLLRILLTQTVSIKYEGTSGFLGSFEDFINENLDNVIFMPFNAEYIKITQTLIEYILEYAQSNGGVNNDDFVNSSLARWYWIQGYDRDWVQPYLDKSRNDYHSVFIESLVSDGGSIDLLKISLEKLNQYKDNRVMPDSYGFIYRIKDLKQLWNCAVERGNVYSDEYVDMIRNLFNGIN